MPDSNEPPNGDHDRLVALEANYAASARRIDEFVEWKHHQLPPIISDLQKGVLDQAKVTATLRGEVVALCAAVDKIAESVHALLTVPAALSAHESECIRGRAEDIVHRERHETWVRGQFDSIRNRQLALHGTLLMSLLTAMGVMGWYIVTHLNVVHP